MNATIGVFTEAWEPTSDFQKYSHIFEAHRLKKLVVVANIKSAETRLLKMSLLGLAIFAIFWWNFPSYFNDDMHII